MSKILILTIALSLLFVGCFNKYSNQKEIKSIQTIIEQNNHLSFKQVNDCICLLTLDYLGEGIGEIQWEFNLQELDKIDISKNNKSIFLRFNNPKAINVTVTEWIDSLSSEEKKERTSYNFVPIYSINESKIEVLVSNIKKVASKCGATIK